MNAGGMIHQSNGRILALKYFARRRHLERETNLSHREPYCLPYVNARNFNKGQMNKNEKMRPILKPESTIQKLANVQEPQRPLQGAVN